MCEIVLFFLAVYEASSTFSRFANQEVAAAMAEVCRLLLPLPLLRLRLPLRRCSCGHCRCRSITEAAVSGSVSACRCRDCCERPSARAW